MSERVPLPEELATEFTLGWPLADVTQISFSVQGELPPKKDGASSMWRKPSEVRRLIALRRAAANEMDGAPPWQGQVALELRVAADVRAGDLDNFVTGICDGLMPAHRSTPIEAAAWNSLPEEARPDRVVVYADDSCISRISAERVLVDGGGIGYEVTLRLL